VISILVSPSLVKIFSILENRVVSELILPFLGASKDFTLLGLALLRVIIYEHNINTSATNIIGSIPPTFIVEFFDSIFFAVISILSSP
jgi:hypothetical protein